MSRAGLVRHDCHAEAQKCAWRSECTTSSADNNLGQPWFFGNRHTADIEIEGYTDDGDEPQDLIEPPDVAAQPVRMVVHERLEQQIEGVNGRQRERVEEE